MARSLRRRAVRVGPSFLHRLILAALVLGVPAAPLAQEPVAGEMLPYGVLYADQSGVTHFRDEAVSWHPRASGSWATAYQEATDIGFLRMPVGIEADWHPAPRKQFVMILQGIGEVEAGDGETRRFRQETSC